jgi:hypothetical protein
MHNSSVRVTTRVAGQTICIASHKDTLLDQRKRENVVKIVRPEQIRIGQRESVVSANSQGGRNRVINVLVKQETYIHD